ncbi:unnamed protein product [Lactuca virosa]|uniref:PPIase cyclophilin-type domain-containing protein n=1 Tax=Lactuca virosa TaxID=75947 RepID=A0AAU9NU95_9ASTR|nr:unnamed protein product [Lactuca virosa]
MQTEEGTSKFQVEDDFSDSKKSDVPRYAIFNTSKGLITVELLYKEGSPEVVDEFIDACQNGHFKGMLFQRVVKHFVIQGGDSENHAVIEDWTSREKHYNQLEKRFLFIGLCIWLRCLICNLIAKNIRGFFILHWSYIFTPHWSYIPTSHRSYIFTPEWSCEVEEETGQRQILMMKVFCAYEEGNGGQMVVPSFQR